MRILPNPLRDLQYKMKYVFSAKAIQSAIHRKQHCNTIRNTCMTNCNTRKTALQYNLQYTYDKVQYTKNSVQYNLQYAYDKVQYTEKTCNTICNPSKKGNLKEPRFHKKRLLKYNCIGMEKKSICRKKQVLFYRLITKKGDKKMAKTAKTYRLSDMALEVIENRDRKKYPSANDFVEASILETEKEKKGEILLQKISKLEKNSESILEFLMRKNETKNASTTPPLPDGFYEEKL